MPHKIFETKFGNRVKWDKTLISAFASFLNFNQNFNSGREIVHEALSSLKLEIYQTFLIYLNLKSFANLRNILYIKILILDINFPFICGELNLYQNLTKFQNIMTTGSPKEISFALCSFSADSSFSKKPYFGSQIRYCWKTTNSQRRKLSKVNFWDKPNMRNSTYTKPLTLNFLYNWFALNFVRLTLQ